jgi:hypothetical protein
MRLGETPYPHTPADTIVLHNDSINPVQEAPIVVCEVPYDNADDLVGSNISDDNGFIPPHNVLEFLGVEIVERFPGFASSGVRIRCCLPVVFPDLLCGSCLVNIMARWGICLLQFREIGCRNIDKFVAPGLGE